MARKKAMLSRILNNLAYWHKVELTNPIEAKPYINFWWRKLEAMI